MPADGFMLQKRPGLQRTCFLTINSPPHPQAYAPPPSPTLVITHLAHLAEAQHPISTTSSSATATAATV